MLIKMLRLLLKKLNPPKSTKLGKSGIPFLITYSNYYLELKNHMIQSDFTLVKQKPTCQTPFRSDKTDGGRFCFRKGAAAFFRYHFARVAAAPVEKM